MAKQVVEHKDIIQLCDILFQGEAPGADALASRMNDQLSMLDLAVKRMRAEHDGKQYWALINTQQDQIAEEWPSILPRMAKLFHCIVTEILQHKGALQRVQVDQFRSKLPQKHYMSAPDASHAVDTLLEQGWLQQGTDNRIHIGVRSMMEFPSLIESASSNEVPRCSLCHESCIYGLSCTSSSCPSTGARVHLHCQADSPDTCPVCPGQLRLPP